MPQLELAFLGTFQVTRNGQLVPRFRVNAARALLAYLAVEADRPHRRETLAGLLWPEVPDVTALKYLRHTLSELRKAIGDDDRTGFLHITRSTLQFNFDRSTWVDVAAFMRGAHSHTLGDLEQAAELYRGAFLEGFSLEGSPAFEEWLLVRQQQLARLAVDVLYRAATQRAESGDYEKAIAHVQHLVSIEPLHEVALRLLMQLFALDGRRNEALAQYETYRRTLAQELKIRPSPELAAEYDRIRAGLWVPTLWVSHLRNEPSESAAPLRTFVAREQELAQLDRALARVRRGLGDMVFVTGEAGSGKTGWAPRGATTESVAIGCGPSFRSAKCSRPLMIPASNSTSFVWGAKVRVFCITRTCINRSINPCCCTNSPKATSRPCSVLATGQSVVVVATGAPSIMKGTRLGVAVQNYIRFDDWPPDCAKLTLDSVTRTQLHEAIGTALEKRYADRPTELGEVALRLAWQFEAAGLKWKATSYGLLAGRRATQLSAYQEASRLLQHSLTLLADVPDSLERARLETSLQLALGAALLYPGWGTPDRARAFDRAMELARQTGATTELLVALHSLTDSAQGRGEVAKAVALSQDLLRLAEQAGQASLLALAHYSLGSSQLMLGELRQARSQLMQALELNDVAGQTRVPLTGADVSITALAWLIVATWLLGDQATAEAYITQVLQHV